MPAQSKEAKLQSERIADFFAGPTGRVNYERLQHFAEWNSGRFRMRAGWGARSGEEFLQEAVSNCLTVNETGHCVRNIPPDVTMMKGLKTIIRSLISHAYESQGFRMSDEMPAVTESKTGEKRTAFEPSQNFWEPDGDRMTPQQREEATSRLDAFIAFTKSDRVVYGMLLLIRDEDLGKPASLIAERLGITEAEVFVARKRLATLVGRYTKQMGTAK